VKVTSNWKEILTQQLLDGGIQEYLMQKEKHERRVLSITYAGRETRQRKKE
jgi:hypothetical protein